MTGIAVQFEMTDALIAQAVREDTVAVAREQLSLRNLLVVAASTAIFMLAVDRDSHWLWWLAALPIALYAVLGVVWLGAYLWLPRYAISRLAHLPNRRVEVAASDSTLSFRTASERLEVVWDEVKAIKRRPHFWLVCLRAGTRIPVPAELLDAPAVELLEARLVRPAR